MFTHAMSEKSNDAFLVWSCCRGVEPRQQWHGGPHAGVAARAGGQRVDQARGHGLGWIVNLQKSRGARSNVPFQSQSRPPRRTQTAFVLESVCLRHADAIKQRFAVGILAHVSINIGQIWESIYDLP